MAKKEGSVSAEEHSRRVSELIGVANDLRRDCQRFDEKCAAQAGRLEELEKDRDRWQVAEHEARQGIPECTLCPHLGKGDPLVDKQAEELQWIKERLAKEMVHLDSLNPLMSEEPHYKRLLERIRDILGGRRCPSRTKDGKPCRNTPMQGERVCRAHYKELGD